MPKSKTSKGFTQEMSFIIIMLIVTLHLFTGNNFLSRDMSTIIILAKNMRNQRQKKRRLMLEKNVNYVCIISTYSNINP